MVKADREIFGQGVKFERLGPAAMRSPGQTKASLMKNALNEGANAVRRYSPISSRAAVRSWRGTSGGDEPSKGVGG